MVQQKLLITNSKIYTEHGEINNGFIKIEYGKITEVDVMENLITNTDEFDVIELPSNYHVIPGMIDVHIHGVHGVDAMDATVEALDTMTTTLPQEGTTSFLATTMTQAPTLIEKALVNTADYMNKHQTGGKSEILGIHLEGPFINGNKAGAQPLEHIIDPNLDLFKKWQMRADGNIKLVTLAPEQPGGLEFIKYLDENGVVASIGHSNATYDQVNEAIKAGVTHITHLFNQMSGLHHREPGIVGAALLNDKLMVEMIADGIHVRPEMIQIALKQKSADQLLIITDSMRAKCLKNGTYDLGGQKVSVQNDTATLTDGTLAGSVLKMNQAFKNMLTYTNCSIKQGVQMASENPAKQLNVFDRKGSITVGKDADLVVLDENLDVSSTFCRGNLAFKRGVDSE